MKLSIIVPVYNMNNGDKLTWCLDSLMNQTLDSYEVIAVDDASTDDSYRVLEEYQKRYPEKLKIRRLEENHRQGGAKNVGLDLSSGEYIGFVDSDDWVMPRMYEKLLEAAEREGADVAACAISMVEEHTYTPGKSLPGVHPGAVGELTEDRFRALINDSGYMVVKIYAGHIFREPRLRFPEHMFYEDNAIGLEVLHRANRIAYVDEPMYFYYQHQGSTVHTATREKCEYRMEAMRIMMKNAVEGGYLDRFYPELEFKFTNLFYQNTLFSYMQSGQRHSISFLRSMARQMRETFPEFEKNPFYLERVNSEERRLMHLQQRSTVAFLLYYNALWFYRRHLRRG